MSDQHAADVPDAAARFRRRWLLPTAGLGVVLLAIVGVAATRSEAERPMSARPAAELTLVPSATATATPQVPTPVPTPSVTATPSRTVSPSRRPAPVRSTGTPVQRGATATSATPRCTPAGVMAGTWSIPQTLKPGTVPFGAGKLNWETGGNC
ncbi:hypothetical protein DLJ46_12105 [Micromonospora globispora]|uniref:Uncharacterized protein n=1 Tax=Micromonospora globispora TaxID=1450148 RepID=A0A317K5V9_9ACTN|nr:hypothetical protein [Micromonospora globispora]PWU48350.1 hypothetical protein DLJ46_12105 [Micromonospora globispora]